MASLTWIVAAIVGAVVIVHWLRTGQSILTNLGFSRSHMLPDFAVGFGIGAVVMAGVFGLHLLLGQILIIDGSPDRSGVLTSLPLLFPFALVEEVVFRGLLLNGLIYLLKSERWSVLLSAVLFGLAHIDNPEATALSVISNGLGGVMYSLAFLGTRRLWLGWGLHFAWNYVQGPVFGFLVSGFNFGGLISHISTGSPILTGGEYGPEGGLIGIAFRFVVMGLVIAYCRRYPTTISKR